MAGIRTSLCMIVRDNERTIGPCLESIRPWVDEMIVVDTGSRDGTPGIVERAGARMGRFPWCDDFAAARNASLSLARGDWVFWMDSDDVISPENGRRLKALAEGTHSDDVLGYVMQVHCPHGGSTDEVTVVDHIKLFRNRRELRFEGRIHEQILPAIRRAGGEVAWTDLFVLHAGSDQTPAGLRRKYERDMRILRLELADHPNHPFCLFNLGMTCADAGDHRDAVEWLRRSLAAAHATESHVPKAYAILASSLVELGEFEAAEEAVTAGLRIRPSDPELTFRAGSLCHRAGRPEQAVEFFQSALQGRRSGVFTSFDRGVVGFKARHNLGLALLDLGNLDQAEWEWRQALAEQPAFRPTFLALVDLLKRLRRFAALDAQADAVASSPHGGPLSAIARAESRWGRQEYDEALQILSDACRIHADDAVVWDCWCALLVFSRRFDQAETALRRLIELRPDDAAALHNLGAVLAERGKWSAAAAALTASLRLRPASVPTKNLLTLAQTELAGAVPASRPDA